MESRLVTRDQFNITPQGITHKPTDAGFTPYPGRPFTGIMHIGRLGNQFPNGEEYRPEDVKRLMQALWSAYVLKNAELFK